MFHEMDSSQTCSKCSALEFTDPPKIQCHSTIQEALDSTCSLCRYMGSCTRKLQSRAQHQKQEPKLDPNQDHWLWLTARIYDNKPVLDCGYGPEYTKEAENDTDWFTNEIYQRHEVLGDVGNPDGFVSCHLTQFLDIKRIRKWIQTCNLSHRHPGISSGAISRLATYVVQGSFRLLDVHSLRTTNMRNPEKIPQYIALSYVWGSANPVLPGQSFDLATLPRTISDAITLLRELQIRYLWIDQICIDQVHDEMDIAIASMGVIYENAEFTIVAASGDNADAGLSGMPGNPRSSEEVLCSFWNNKARTTLELVEGRTWHFDEFENNCCYSTRAWTFQEFIFARRALVFLPMEIMFICGGKFVSERHAQTNCPHRNELPAGLFVLRRLGEDVKSARGSFFCYWTAVERYTSLQLTKEEDRLLAFAGVLSRGDENDPIVLSCGLPLFNFQFGPALAWQLSDVDDPYKAAPDHKVPFAPSWSWASAGRNVNYSGVNVSDVVRPFEYRGSLNRNAVIGRPCLGFWRLDTVRDVLGSLSKSSWSEALTEAHRSFKGTAAHIARRIPVLQFITITFTGRLGHRGRRGEVEAYQIVPNEPRRLTMSPARPDDEPDWPQQSVWIDTGKYGEQTQNEPAKFAVIWVNCNPAEKSAKAPAGDFTAQGHNMIGNMFSDKEELGSFYTLLLRWCDGYYERVGLARIRPPKMKQLLSCKDSDAKWEFIEVR